MFNILASEIVDLYKNSNLNFKLGDADYWQFIVCIAMIFVALLVANLLIEVIKPLKKALIPSPVLGGFIVLIFLNVYQWVVGSEFICRTILEILTYHLLGIGFIASALKKKSATDKEAEKKAQKAVMRSSFITVSGYLIQAVVGLIISIVVSLIFVYGIKGYTEAEVFPASGALVPMGFGQGPGQAFNWGKIFSEPNKEGKILSDFGLFKNGIDFGKSIAALGFFASAIGGIIFLNVEKKKGNIKMTSRLENAKEVNTLATYEADNEIESSGNIDKLSVQLGLVLIVYLLTYLVILGITSLAVSADGTPIDLVYNTLWGFNFLVGTGLAALVVMIFNKLEKKGVMKRSYINNYQMDRISGFSFDVMVIAAIGSIDLNAFANITFVIPLTLMFILCTIATYVLVKKQCYHYFKEEGYAEEEFLAMFGMLTGTASTGVILLRQIDPQFKTPACNNLVFQALWAVVFGAPVLLLMNLVYKGWTELIISLVIFALYLVAMCIVVFGKFNKKPSKAKKALKE